MSKSPTNEKNRCDNFSGNRIVSGKGCDRHQISNNCQNERENGALHEIISGRYPFTLSHCPENIESKTNCIKTACKVLKSVQSYEKNYLQFLVDNLSCPNSEGFCYCGGLEPSTFQPFDNTLYICAFFLIHVDCSSLKYFFIFSWKSTKSRHKLWLLTCLVSCKPR